MIVPLPIDPLLPQIASVLRTAGALVLTAPPGAGKTTRVPRALLEAGFAGNGEILVLEPRRIAARLAAARVAEELGEQTGRTVGYSIRFETAGGPQTRIRFLTEGILSRRIIDDPDLTGVSTIILDEFHERHIHSDIALAFLKRLRNSRRPDLNLVVMSATLEAEPVASFLGNAPVLTGEGRRFEISIEHEPQAGSESLRDKVVAAVQRLLRSGVQGDILVFLPGAAEIRQAAAGLAPFAAANHLLVLPLHGSLPLAAQSRAVKPAGKMKIVLATNVAESSITIPGIAAVVDGGLARIAAHSPWSGLPTLTLSKISRASATQRAGRAGRTRAGRVVRLYTRHDFETRPESDLPEIQRSDLAETVLTLHGAGISSIRGLQWLDPPADTAVEAAEELLLGLGAVDAAGSLTRTGRAMLRFPVHPRLARLIVEGEHLGVGTESALLAALISERDIRRETQELAGSERRPTGVRPSGASDLLELHDLFNEAAAAQFDPGRLRSLDLDPQAVRSAERSARHLQKRLGPAREKPISEKEREESLMVAALAAFPDRVARRRSRGSRELILSSRGSARLADSSVVHKAPLMVVVDAEERSGSRGALDLSPPLVRLASAIEPEWLAAMFPDAIEETIQLSWNESAGRVEEVRQTRYLQLVLEERVRPATPSDAVAELLASKAQGRDLADFGDAEGLAPLRARLSLCADRFKDSGMPSVDEGFLESVVKEICRGANSLAALREHSIVKCVLERTTPAQGALLRREAPERITLPGGRILKVHYDVGRPPWIESRLQDFWGMDSTPAVCGGRVPLTVHLLAPNQRAVQVTQDLAGFWERHYPELRRQLQRRYPKHAWPEPGSRDR